MTNEEIERSLISTRDHFGAQIVCVLAQVRALREALCDLLPETQRRSMRKALYDTSRTHLQKLMISLEDKNPGLAAAVQAILDGELSSDQD